MHLPQNTRLYNLPEIYAQRQTPLGLALCQLWVNFLSERGVANDDSASLQEDVAEYLDSYLSIGAYFELLVDSQQHGDACSRHTLLGIVVGMVELDATVPVAKLYCHDVISGDVLGQREASAAREEMQQRFLRYTFEIGQQRGCRGTVVDLCLPDTSGPRRFRFVRQDGHFVPQP